MIAGNKADFFGGGIYLSEGSLWDLVHVTGSLEICNGSAPRGSAVTFYHLQNSTKALHNITFSGNVADVGGTVFWIKDDVLSQEPNGAKSHSIVWRNNTASYGEQYATQAIRLIGPSEVNVTHFESAIQPPITYYMTDEYDQFIPVSGGTTVSTTISNSSVNNCSDQYYYLSGQNVIGLGVTIETGFAEFADLQAYCFPKGKLLIEFTARLADLSVISTAVTSQYYITNHTVLSFRSCVAGEYRVNGLCKPCPDGSYSLTTDATSCTSCSSVTGVSSCSTNQIEVASGYWRRFPETTAVIACILPNGCLGGNVTANQAALRDIKVNYVLSVLMAIISTEMNVFNAQVHSKSVQVCYLSS